MAPVWSAAHIVCTQIMFACINLYIYNRKREKKMSEEFVPDVCLAGTWCLCCTMLFYGPHAYDRLHSPARAKVDFIADTKGKIHAVDEDTCSAEDAPKWWQFWR